MSDACCAEPARTAAGPPPATRAWAVGEPGVVAVSGAALAVSLAAEWIGAAAWSAGANALVIILTAPPAVVRAWRALAVGVLDIHVLMVVAVAGAVALGEWSEAATVVWLFGVAEWLERRSLSRARNAVRALMQLSPELATVRRHDQDVVVPVGQVRVGERLVVRPGERVPVDGVVRAGHSAVNQAPITGEAVPVEKSEGDEVYAGSINGYGALEMESRRVAADSTLARIGRLVAQAEGARAPVQTFVDRFARRYTPAVALLAALVAVVPPLVPALTGDAGFAAAFPTWAYRALALLVVACPCALVISTPVAVVSALTAAARQGVLIKGGTHLERLGAIRSVAFDKTGTLTHGRVQVTEIVGLGGATRDGVLSVAAALESRSEHPIGRAIVSHARAGGVPMAAGTDFRALPGLGAEATIASGAALVGSHRLFEERRLCTPALHACLDEVEGRGATPVIVGHQGAPCGVIGLSDEVRADGRWAVADLRDAGVERIVLLTGDRPRPADVVSSAVGLDEAQAELLPADKVDALRALRTRYGPVAMVGDGVNDAPALAAADVGIAMGAAGSDVALETADVVLMGDDLRKLPFALRLGRAALGTIRQNIAVALGLKAAFVVLAIAGVATMWMAILADTGASLLVTANSLRLLRAGRPVDPMLQFKT